MNDSVTNLRLRLGGVVLCGGGSRRMGRDKGHLPIGQDSMLAHVAKRVAQAAKPVVVATQHNRNLPPLSADVRVVFDSVTDGGPLAGILAGMNELEKDCEAVFVCACDQPLIRPSFVERLRRFLEGYDAVVPFDCGRLHPLTAIYRLSVQSVLAEMVVKRELRAIDFVARTNAYRVSAAEILDVDPGMESLLNINDEAAYQSMLRRVESPQQH